MIARPKMSQIEWKTTEIRAWQSWKCLTRFLPRHFVYPPPGLDANHFHANLLDASERQRDSDVTWEGTDVDAADLPDRGYAPHPVRAGTLLVFAGTLDHLSLPNKSDRQRHTFQLHVIESQDVTWHSSNWLQTKRPGGFLQLGVPPESSQKSDNGEPERARAPPESPEATDGIYARLREL